MKTPRGCRHLLENALGQQGCGRVAVLLVVAATALIAQPLRSFAQVSSSDEQASPAPSQPQAIPAVPSTAAPNPKSALDTRALTAAAVSPETPQPTEKQKRQAEKAFLQGAKAIEQDDPRAAYEAFSHAVKLDSTNRQYSLSSEIARQHLVTLLVQEAGKARLTGHPEVSRQKLEEALALDPKNPIAAQHVEELAADESRTGSLIHEEQINEQTGEPDADFAGPIELTPAAGTKSFHLKTTQQDVLRQVLSAYQITPVMDKSVTQLPVRLDVDDVDYAKATELAKLLTGTFFVPLDPKRVLVAKDTKENRKLYERLLLESIYLPGLTPTELTDMSNLAKNVFDAPVAAVQAQRNILTVRAPENRMKALNATLEELLGGRAQVMIEVRLYDIARTRTTNLGIVLPSQTTVFNVDSELNTLLAGNQSAINQIIASGLAAPGDYAAILAILIASGQITSSILTQGFVTFGGGLTQFGLALGQGVTGNLSLNSSDSRVLDDIHLRAQDAEAATFKVGTRYPIVTSTVSSGGSGSSIAGINTAGLSSTLSGLGISLSSLTTQVTIPQIQYQDLGLTLKVTPQVQHNQEIALKMELEFTALGGSTINGNPILNNRKYTGTITLGEGASAVVVSNLSKQETKAVTGLPGLSDIPGLQSTTDDSKDLNISNLVVLVTPHILRGSHADMAGKRILFPLHE